MPAQLRQGCWRVITTWGGFPIRRQGLTCLHNAKGAGSPDRIALNSNQPEDALLQPDCQIRPPKRFADAGKAPFVRRCPTGSGSLVTVGRKRYNSGQYPPISAESGREMKRSWLAAVGRSWVGLLVVIGLPLCAAADTIVLKNGRRVEVEMAWREGDEVKGTLSGVVVRYAEGQVERIERPDPAAADAVVDGFSFDIWTSGMSLADVRRAAENRGIILQEGAPEGSSGPAATPSGSPSAVTGMRQHYREVLLEKPAVVWLAFTPVSQMLYRLMIHWEGDGVSVDSEFFKTVFAELTAKYGQPDQRTPRILALQYSWKVNKHGAVNLEADERAVAIAYNDRKLAEAADSENRRPRQP
jgi:hypothetical protein